MNNSRYNYDIRAEEDENEISILDKIRHTLIEVERKENERDDKTTMIVVDSINVQNTDTTEIQGYDAGKKSSIKIHIDVYILGLSHAIMLTAAKRVQLIWLIITEIKIIYLK